MKLTGSKAMTTRPAEVTRELETICDNLTYSTLLNYIHQLEKEVVKLEDDIEVMHRHIAEDEPFECF